MKLMHLACSCLLYPLVLSMAIAQDEGRPLGEHLLIEGALETSDPMDHIRKESHHRHYEVFVEKGKKYGITLTSRDFDPWLRIEGYEKVIGENNDDGVSKNARQLFSPTSSGKVRLVVTSAKPKELGKYQITIQQYQPDGKPEIRGDTLTDTAPLLVQKYHYHLQKVMLSAAKHYQLALKGDGFEPRLVLFTPGADGQLEILTGDSGSGPDGMAQLLFTPAQDGEYILGVTTIKPGATGKYAVGIQPLVAVRETEKPLPIPSGLSGRLSKEDPLDRVRTKSHHKVHSIHLESDKEYAIEVHSTQFNPFLRLEDNEGKQLIADERGGGVSTPRMVFMPLKSETYRIIVTSSGEGQTGDYVVRITPVEPSGRPTTTFQALLQEGAPVMAGKFPFQVHPLTLVGGQWYSIDVTSASFSPGILLRNAAGQYLAGTMVGDAAAHRARSAGGMQSRILVLPPANGTYELLATGVPGSVGDFQVDVVPYRRAPRVALPHASHPQSLVIEGNLAREQPLDRVKTNSRHQIHRLPLDGEKQYRIELQSSDFSPYLRLEDADGQQIAVKDGAGFHQARLLFAPHQSGEYRVVATSSAVQETGSYDLIVEEFASVGEPKVLAGMLSKESPLDRNSLPYEVHLIELTEGQWYQMEMTSQAFEPALVLRDSEDQIVGTGSSAGDAMTNRLLYYSGAKGTYRLDAIGSQAAKGNYEIKIQPCGPIAVSPPKFQAFVAQGKLTEKSLSHPATRELRYETHSVPMEAAKQYCIELHSPDFYPVLHVLDARGQELHSTLWGASPAVARQYFLPPRTEEYELRVLAVESKTGTYTLRVDQFASAGGPQFVEGQLSQEADLHDFGTGANVHHSRLHEVRLRGDRHYQISVQSSGFEPGFIVQNFLTHDKSTAFGGPTPVFLSPQRDQRYEMHVYSRNKGETGSYKLIIQPHLPLTERPHDPFGEPPSPPQGEFVRAVLSHKDPADPRFVSRQKVHTVQLEAGKPYRIDAWSSDFSLCLRVEDTVGNMLAKDLGDAGRLLFIPKQTGVYRLIVSNRYPRHLGEYVLSIQEYAAVGEPSVETGKLDPSGPMDVGLPYRGHRRRLELGKTYQIDLVSKDFQPLLVVADQSPFPIGGDIDESGGGPGNARVLLSVESSKRRTVTGIYEIRAMSPDPKAVGDYTLRIQQVKLVPDARLPKIVLESP
jgi:hypothetical protein